MRNIKTSKDHKISKFINRILLQLVVFTTFVGILPTVFLIFINLYRGNYINALISSGIMLSLIKANKSVQ